MKNRYKFLIAYDGTNYAGWQQQPDRVAVSNVLEKTFKHVFQKDCYIIGASRTDAGVHALGQVALVYSDLSIPPESLKHALNNRLPKDVLVRDVQIAHPGFHPQDKVDYKIYWYHFFTQRPLPFASRYGYTVSKQIDLDKLNEALRMFVGTHDFRSFCSGDHYEHTMRTIDEISISYIKYAGCYRITFKGHSFLRYMIRRLTGAALEVATHPTITLDYLAEIFDKKNPEHTLPSAPAHGLTLAKIRYHQLEIIP